MLSRFTMGTGGGARENGTDYERNYRTSVRPTITLAIFRKLHLDEYPTPLLSLWSFIAVADSGALERRCWWFKRHSLPGVCTAMSASRFAHSRCSRNFFWHSGQYSATPGGPGLFPLKLKVWWICLSATAAGHPELLPRPLHGVCNMIADTNLISHSCVRYFRPGS